MLATGSTLSGRYRLDAPLGSGATAAVWRARDLELGREVAIKVLYDGGVDPELASRFTREGRILGRLNHPNIVPVLAAGVEDGQPYLVMTLIEGPSLKERIARGPVPIDEAVSLVADIAAGLAAVHEAGVVHRDVKPGNIVCGDDGIPRLVDFGIARAGDLTTMTQADVVLGTAAYLSPEQAKGAVPGPPSDVYSLGVVLFELLTGRQPFEAESMVGVAYRHVHDAPATPSSLRREVPAALDAIVLRCLAKRPEERYPDAAALEDALRRWETAAVDVTVAIPVAAVTSPEQTAVLPIVDDEGEPPPAMDRRKPLFVLGAAVAAIALVGLLTATTSHDNATTTPTTTSSTATTIATTTTAAAPPTTAAVVNNPPAKGKHGKRGD